MDGLVRKLQRYTSSHRSIAVRAATTTSAVDMDGAILRQSTAISLTFCVGVAS
ncbi:hypothetical protein [Streptomyces sp. NPDC058622]|uniref:hypothetical protein n=1 Tax=Streptomyces sp. NPDC058622 TaxID=3346562 RepID=UPI00364A4F83